MLILIIFQVMFEAVRGAGFQSDIALDDIGLTDGPCGKFGCDLTPFCSNIVTICIRLAVTKES